MKKKHAQDNKLDDKIYTRVNLFSLKFWILGFFLFLMGLFINFPIKKYASIYLKKILSSSRRCPIQFEQMTFGKFFHYAQLDRVQIPGRCYGQPSARELYFETIRISPQTPSLNPPGINLKISIKNDKTHLILNPTLSYPSFVLNVVPSTLDTDLIEQIIGKVITLNGRLQVESKLLIEKSNIQKGVFSITSKNLTIPPQNTMGFEVPLLGLNHIKISGVVNTPNTVEFKTIHVGGQNSPIFGRLSGTLKINTKSFRLSQVEVQGKIKFSKRFIDDFKILNLFLSGKKADAKGRYPLSISGKIGRPKIFIK
jgi:hypothetical protein